jgi:GTP-binding protein YchF
MQTAIIGLPLAGKTTLFNALTGSSADTSAYVGGRGGLNLAEVTVPDHRVEKLTRLFSPRKKTLATVQFKDLQTQFTPQGGFSDTTIAELRASDAITLVVRAFEDAAVPHPLDRPDPFQDLRNLLDTLVFSDFEVVERRLERLSKERKTTELEGQRLTRIREKLEGGQPLGEQFLTPQDHRLFSGFAFLTAKPILLVANTGSAPLETGPMERLAKELAIPVHRISGQTEMEIAQLPEEDQAEFLADVGLQQSARDRFLQAIYDRLDLISFLTAGEDEVRAWSIPKQTLAPKAAGQIHSDLERGFIRTEVVRWDDLLEAGGFKEAKSGGKTRTEGKQYLVKDGDVLTVLFNV